MTFTNVLLICLGGICGCAALVFAVETLVAFCFHDKEQPLEPTFEPVTSRQGPILLAGSPRETHVERAA